MSNRNPLLLTEGGAAGYVLAKVGKVFKPVDPSTLTPAGHFSPSANNTYDLGLTGTRWRTLYLGTSINVPQLVMAPSAATSGVRSAISLTGAADTGLTAATEQTDVDLNLGRTVTWAAGAGPLASQRAIRVRAPTLAGNAGGALVITNASTVEIDNAPQAGSNMTLTNAWALRVVAGGVYLGGAVTLGSTLSLAGAQTTTIDDALNTAVTRGLTLSHTTSNTAQAGVGAGMLLRAESGAGTLRSAGAVDAIHTDVTDGAEISALVFGAGIAGTILEVARLAAVASAVNGVSITAAATGGDPTIAARGSDTNVSLALRGKGTGAALLGAASGDNSFGVSTAGLLVDSDTQTGATPTVNRNSGTVRVQSGNTSVTVNNNLCTANSRIFAQICETTTNAVSILRVTRGAGSFVITLSGDPGASHADIAFFMIQPDA